ncbi:nodulation protein D [Azorhizobium caulinodans ORS 571]|uniref:Nodulation protein D n=1 Tax=Azorhizobium caulinodans (strain ATCC 43989 / DSM 5975 / JCM 20966 / LMG 6465 / NBRC 14845 / NCIMB 13405 / ORS 571) TaxID=438753 RepID=NODD_AZOC5|nr:LysR family transcriptional regulator [Azorhizobium caulinodans]P20669.2 RecName: Full=Nodulation protein D [Azorhizobium caulinodans ORS 571]BAF89790.1 nodulation protein D [Azorhizobium caulinodans ORS 571]
MRFKGLDLNLLVALNALLSEHSVTSAAKSINLSQPAMSAAVQRLRIYFNDDLFTINGRERVFTARAESLAPAVRDILSRIQSTIIKGDLFEADRSERVFRIISSDYSTSIFIRGVISAASTSLPLLRFELISPDDNCHDLLNKSEVDALIMPEIFMSSAHPFVPLFEEKMVCVGCARNHEDRNISSIQEYLSMRHVVAKFGRGMRPSLEEWFMAENGMRRRIDIVVQSFSMIPPVIQGTERIAIMPYRLVEHFSKFMPLKVFALPFPLPRFTECLQWPSIATPDLGNRWLRAYLADHASQMMILDSAEYSGASI